MSIKSSKKPTPKAVANKFLKDNDHANEDLLNKPFLRDAVKEELGVATSKDLQEPAYVLEEDLEDIGGNSASEEETKITEEITSVASPSAKTSIIDWDFSQVTRDRARLRIIFIALTALLIIVAAIYVQQGDLGNLGNLAYEDNSHAVIESDPTQESVTEEVTRLQEEIATLSKKREELLRREQLLRQQLDQLQTRINQQ